MKKLLLIFCLFLFSIGLSAQTQNESDIHGSGYTSHSMRDASISFSPNVLFNNTDKLFIGGGMKFRLFVGDRFSFDSDCVIGPNYSHYGPGIIGLPLWYFGSLLHIRIEDQQSLEAYVVFGLLMILSAEHFSYHIPIQYMTDISPYVSFLRYKSITESLRPEYSDKTENSTNFAFGLEINQYYGRFVLSPYIDYDIAYTGQNHSLNFGFSLGYYFPTRD